MQRRLVLTVLALFAFVFLQAHPGFAQSGQDIQSLKKDVESLKAGQKTIEKEIQGLKKLLQARQAPRARAAAPFKETEIDIDHAPFKGKKDAKLVLVEFSDYQ